MQCIFNMYFSFELSVDMLDYMDDILTLQAQGDYF